MNCKPGDMAVIVKGEGIDRCLIGRVVRVTTVSQTQPSVCWFYEGERLRTILGELIGVADAYLQPIRGDGVPSVQIRELETSDAN